jgi:hypothetical protein
MRIKLNPMRISVAFIGSELNITQFILRSKNLKLKITILIQFVIYSSLLVLNLKSKINSKNGNFSFVQQAVA